MKNTNDLYICIEGIDGCGKTTVINELKKLYPDAVFTREPGSEQDKFCSIVRRILLEDGVQIDDEVSLYLFIADRIQHMKKVVIPALVNNRMVISDRCFLSTFAYQQKFGIDYLFAIHSQITMADPDIIFIIDTDPKIAYQRLIERCEVKQNANLYYLLKRIRQNFLNMQTYFPEIIEVVDGNKPLDKIVETINKSITQYANIMNNVVVVQ